METTISQRALRNNSGEIMRRVEGGERFTVTRSGVPVADLVPHGEADLRRRFVPVSEIEVGIGQLPKWDADGSSPPSNVGQPMTREQALAMRGAQAIGEVPADTGSA